MKLAQQSIFVPADFPHDVRVSVCSSGDESEYSDVSDDEDTKMVLVVRSDLKMSGGKTAAQCAHASVGVYRDLLKSDPGGALDAWERGGMAKIVVKTRDEVSMLKVLQDAESRGIPFHLVKDAGRTEVEPGACTVLAVGPAPIALVDEVTGHLKLL